MRRLLCAVFHAKWMLSFYTATTAKQMVYVGSVCTKCHDLVNVEALYNKLRSA